MANKLRISGKDFLRCQELMAAMPKVPGETRAVERCDDCGHLFGRRFVPYGLGTGLTVDPCTCQITAHRTSTTVVSKTDRRSDG